MAINHELWHPSLTLFVIGWTATNEIRASKG
jgi:hypothetical protein